MGSFAEEKTIRREGCDIHYWISRNANGPWLIFLHGAGLDHRMFDSQIPPLRDNYRILAWDARGHGLSRPIGTGFSIKLLVNDLDGIMDNENIHKATLIGHSMGGNTAQEMVFCHPRRVENLVLIDCICNTVRRSAVDRLAINIASPVLPLWPWKYIVEQSVRVSSVKAEVQGYLRETIRVVGRKNFRKILRETAACLHYEKGYKINKPMLLVCGEKDNLGNIKKINQLWPSRELNCECHIIKNASHCSNQDNPQEFNRLLVEFLSRQYSSSR